MRKTISPKSALAILSEHVPPIIYTTIASLVVVNPIWGILFISAMGIIRAWGDFGQARINELVKFIDEHKEEFVADILKTPKFKSVFLNVLERHMKETMEEKRKILRSYLLNVGKGINKDFDYHTKILLVVDQITLDEIAVLNILYKKAKNQSQKLDNLHLNLTRIPELEKYNQDYLRDILNTLHAFRLITVTEATVGAVMVLKQITNFGVKFLEFIKE